MLTPGTSIISRWDGMRKRRNQQPEAPIRATVETPNSRWGTRHFAIIPLTLSTVGEDVRSNGRATPTRCSHCTMRRPCTTNWSRGVAFSGGNLTDLLLRREPPPARDYVPAGARFRPKPSFATGLGHRHFVESYGYHFLLVVLIYFFSTSTFFNRPVRVERLRSRTRRWTTIR